MVVNKDILGGLKSALTRGYSLEEAMLSFFNAGYKREEIEEAARTLQGQISTATSEWQPQPIWAAKTGAPPNAGLVSQKQITTQITAPQSRYVSRVSAYPSTNPRIKMITIILVILLVVLLAILGLMYLFKNQIISFLNSIFASGT